MPTLRRRRPIVASAWLCGGLAVAIALCGGLALADADATIPFPADYRGWAHVKSVLVGPESPAFATEAGIHHIYANPAAADGYRAGRFPDGAVIVYDLLDVIERGGVTSEGAQKRVDVMVKDSRRFAETGGWGFARFGPDHRDGTLSAQAQAGCATCHAKRRDRDFVFSELRP